MIVTGDPQSTRICERYVPLIMPGTAESFLEREKREAARHPAGTELMQFVVCVGPPVASSSPS